ncbi:D-alanyl-D-alanine carboxypeptidase [Alicyclobacillus tolerans]|uniref:D-alanyl-D-alanine carboxypeptidase family protein n=1 Tax=Alicyclobacillus tolerans TaxID=90970 RepID=UPI001F3198C2|nr:D-alanyl-D-alanine carboxypeptidase family protein [Alicyclobacillus tolerans]MCF8565799.1 D-alanyl-D-alanine carboxypeptidase [Alicyclobacillus tolerans]
MNRSIRNTGRFFKLAVVLFAVVPMLLWLCPTSPQSTALAAEKTAGRVFVNAKAAVVLDARTGDLLYSKNADTPMYPASTTKLMTAVLLVTHLHPDDPVFVSRAAARQARVRLGLKPGTTLTADEALHALLMKSANDVAYAVAETVGGSQMGFARMMNLKARLIGCTHTNFVTPNGLHADEHMTSAHDVALILREAIRYPEIVKAMHTTDYTVAGKTIRNTNRLMYLKQSTFGEVIGGKTGFTSKAMYCLAFAARQKEGVRISVVLGAPRKSSMYRETRRLLEMAYRDKNVQIV